MAGEKDDKNTQPPAGGTTPPEPVVLKKGQIVVDEKTLATVLEKQAVMEKEIEDQKAKNAGLEALMLENKDADTVGEKKLRERKKFEPAFRTVTMKKFPVAGDPENQGIVIGWTNRGAYQKVDKSGVAAQRVDYIDTLVLGKERGEDGTLQAESVPLLSLLGAPEIVCKIIETKDYEGKPFKLRYSPLVDPDLSSDRQGEDKVATGEEIRIKEYDIKHGLMETGDIIDGWVGYTNLTFVLQIPGWAEPVEVDSKYVNI